MASRLLLKMLGVSLVVAACKDSPAGPDAQSAAAASLVSGNGQQGTVGMELSSPLVIRVTDSNGNGVRGQRVTWSAASGSFRRASSVTDRQGYASAAWVMGTEAGPQSAQARVAELSAISFSAVAMPGEASVLRLDPDSLFFDAVGDSVLVAVDGSDRFDNLIESSMVRWLSSDTSVTIVTSGGVVRSRGAGAATITAMSGSAAASIAVVVSPRLATLRLADTMWIRSVPATIPLQLDARDRNGYPIRDVQPTISRISESRWVRTLPVLDDDARLATDSIYASGAGTVSIRAQVNGVESNISVVNVAPAMPLVQIIEAPSVLTHSDVITIMGYKLDALAPSAVSVEGTGLTILYQDSATVVASGLPAPSTCHGAAMASVEVSGAEVQSSSTFRRARDDEIVLSAGEARILAGDVCVRLPPDGSAVYALAFYDDRHIVESERQPEVEPGSYGDYTAVVRDNSSPRAPTEPNLISPSAAARTTEWESHIVPMIENVSASMTRKQVGDTVTYFDYGLGTTVQGIVVLVQGKWVVSRPAFRPDLFTPNLLAAIDTALRAMDQEVVPMLQDAFVPVNPETWAGTEQFHIETDIFPEDGTCGGNATAARILLICPRGANASTAARTLAHELTHTFQQLYLHDQRANGQPAPSPAVRRSSEAGAELVKIEFVRRRLQQGLTSNNPLGERRPTETDAEQWWWFGVHRDFRLDVYLGVRLLHDLLVRAIWDGGLSYEDALRMILRSSLHEWYACHANACHPEISLAGKMRALLGDDWTPTVATLTYIASQLLDDRTTSQVYQNRSFHGIWQYARNPGRPEDQPVPVLVAGESGALTLDLTVGSGGAVYLQDDGRGGSFHGTLSNGGKWIIARIE